MVFTAEVGMSAMLRIVGIDGIGAGIIDALVLNGVSKEDCVLLTVDRMTARESEAGKVVQVGEEELSELGELDGREEPSENVLRVKQRVETACIWWSRTSGDRRGTGRKSFNQIVASRCIGGQRNSRYKLGTCQYAFQF